MSALAAALREVWGLFVEDPSFTAGIVASLLLAALLFPLVGLPLAWRGPALFALLVLVLLENTRRSARK